jgi:TonB family protein
MKQTLIFFFVLVLKTNYAQVSNVHNIDSSTKSVFVYPEQMPEYPGGDGAMLQLIRYSLIYPEGCEKLPGRVVVAFWVNEDGTISDAAIVSGLCVRFDAAVIAVLKKLKHFIPGYTNGKAVRTKLVLPIRFE